MSVVRDVDDLKARVAAGHTSYSISLAGGAARSSKTIHHQPEADKPWDVWNGIDDSWQEMTDDELYSESNIGYAIDVGALVDDDGPLPSPFLGGGPGDPSPFDAYELHDVAEYENHGYYYCETIDGPPEDDEDTRVEKVMVSLYGHFKTGGVHCITDREYDADLKDARAEAIDYILRLAHSIADGKPVHDFTYAEEKA